MLKNHFKMAINSYLNSTLFYSYDVLTLQTFLEYVTRSIKNKFNLTFEEKVKLGFEIQDMLINCRFNNHDCDYKSFDLFYSDIYGNCYKYNSGRGYNGSHRNIESTSGTGRTNALKLELFVGYPSEDLDVITSNGAIIFVHNNTVNPLVDSEGVSVSTGFETDIVLNQISINRRSYPFSECILDTETLDAFDSELFRTTIQVNQRYSQKYCLTLCYQKYIISKCGCYDSKVLNFQKM